MSRNTIWIAYIFKAYFGGFITSINKSIKTKSLYVIKTYKIVSLCMFSSIMYHTKKS